MLRDNYAYVNQALGILARALLPFIEERFQAYNSQTSGRAQLEQAVRDCVLWQSKRFTVILDAEALLMVTERRWDLLFRAHFQDRARRVRSWVNGLIDVRGRCAHADPLDPLSDEDRDHALSTIVQLLTAIKSDEADAVRYVRDLARSGIEVTVEATGKEHEETSVGVESHIKAADAVWIATAFLHRENPEREDFSVSEIISQVDRLRLYQPIHPTVPTHVRQHCVANKPPQPGKYRMLYETASSKRRLFRHGDDVYSGRNGKIVPQQYEVPEKYWDLLDWYQTDYDHDFSAMPVSTDTASVIDQATHTEFDVLALLSALAVERPIFHDEADFKRALAGQIRRAIPRAHISYEQKAFANELKRLDILVEVDGGKVAIELKYPTRKIDAEIFVDFFALKDQAAQDLTRYDFVKDISRLERMVQASSDTFGCALLLTNDSAYWKPPVRVNVADTEFRIHERANLSGTRAWAPHAGPGTTAGREQVLDLKGAYQLTWHAYSTLPVNQTYNQFRYVLVLVPRNSTAETPARLS